ncbi:cellulose binding domain-containing protein [Stackebrandtia endophytica]|nr:cellulose binding domain-containing protein [Stackebrandtia endophytica]
MATLRRKFLALATAGVLSLIAAPAAHADPTTDLHVGFEQTSIWATGYTATVTLTNDSPTAVDGWTIEFDLPSGTRITNSWSSQRTTTGDHHRFDNAAFNGLVSPGGSRDFGFTVTGLGTPLDCTVNGAPCQDGTPPDTEAPTVPTGLRVVATTTGSVTLGWNAATDDTGVTGYLVERDGTRAQPHPGTEVTVTGLAADTEYRFTVSAEDAAGNRSAASTSVSVRTLPARGSGAVIDVGTADELTAALASVQPGDTIALAPGEYRGSFRSTNAGTAQQPITITGPADAVLVNPGPSGTAPSCPAPEPGWNSGYGFWLYEAPHWMIEGFTVADSKKGIVIDDSSHVTIDGVRVQRIDDEGVHFRKSSSDGVIRDSVVEHTGLAQPQYGEGVYIGSAVSNWRCYGNTGGADRSDRVQVLDNRIGPWVGAEHIDVKEGTFGGVIAGNTFHGQGLSGQNYADSWVDVKGVDYLIEGNTGDFESPGVFAHGYEVHGPTTSPAFPNGCGNVWRNNHSDLGGVGGWAVNVTTQSRCDSPNIVYASNTVSGATNGLTNIPVTP